MGPTALSFHRAALRLQALGVPLLPRALLSLGVRLHATWLDPEARLAQGVELGYGGVGVVIAAGVEVGPRTFISQHVTLGPRLDVPGVPRLGRDIFIGTGAKVLGPVTVGDGAVIGANAVVLDDVAPGAVVAGIPARELRRHATTH
jgi:serine O-acetyltransferase